MRAPLALAAAAALMLVIAGCASRPEPATVAPAAQPASAAAEAGRVVVDVALPIVLVGLPNGTGAALSERLGGTLLVEHETYNFAFEFPPTVVGAAGAGGVPLALVPRAAFSVHEAPAGLAETLRGELAAAEEDGLWSANQAEDRLAGLLPAAGLPLDPSAPTLVFLALGSPGYRYQQTTGYLEGVRVFGERHPLVALDVSAPADPFVGSGPGYTSPLRGIAAQDPAEAAKVLAEAVEDAVNFRLLQGPIYPPTLRECHGVTLAIGVRAASAAQLVEGDYADAVDTVVLDRAWTNATASDVEVDAVNFLLPLDDPGLDAALRAASSGAPGGLDALRQWAAMNWDSYWVPHEGCEAYVSFLIVGDAGDASLFGIAMYDVAEGHRVSLGVVPDLTRLREGTDGPLSPLNPLPESRERPNWANFLFAHETGHLLGQRHPHDVSLAGGDAGFTFAWSSVWSSMTYESADRLVDFGAVDQNNHLRNRAGEALQAVYASGGQPSTEALVLLGDRQWDAATSALLAGLPSP